MRLPRSQFRTRWVPLAEITKLPLPDGTILYARRLPLYVHAQLSELRLLRSLRGIRNRSHKHNTLANHPPSLRLVVVVSGLDPDSGAVDQALVLHAQNSLGVTDYGLVDNNEGPAASYPEFPGVPRIRDHVCSSGLISEVAVRREGGLYRVGSWREGARHSGGGDWGKLGLAFFCFLLRETSGMT